MPGFFFAFTALLSLKSSVFKMPLLRLPLWLPLSGQNVFNEPVHSHSTFFMHLVGDMTINIQGECRGSMAQMFLHRFNIITGTGGGYGKRKPSASHFWDTEGCL